jgi:hypothetical protein
MPSSRAFTLHGVRIEICSRDVSIESRLLDYLGRIDGGRAEFHFLLNVTRDPVVYEREAWGPEFSVSKSRYKLGEGRGCLYVGDCVPLTSCLADILRKILPKRGMATYHAACVARRNEGTLIFGAPSAGKSTMALSLLERGYDFLSDDIVFVDARLLVLAFPTEAKVDSMEYYPEFNGYSQEARYIDVLAWGARIRSTAVPTTLIFLRKGSAMSFREIDRKQSLVNTLLSADHELGDPRVIFDNSASLIHTSKCYELTLTDDKRDEIAEVAGCI